MFGHPGYSFQMALALAVLPLLAIVAAGYAGRRWPFDGRRLTVILEHSSAPIVAGAIATLLTWWAWGSASEPGAIHDERAYLLQARIFAAGRWSAPTPPEPAFWEQMHVFVRPVTAAKYPPLHAAVLAPGAALGYPGLVPLLLTAVTAALVYALSRRLAGVWIALVTWLLWSTSTTGLVWRGSYLSQVTTAGLWVGSMVLLMRWRDTRRPASLLGVVALLSGMALTRPLTAVALGAPIALVMAADCVRERRWKLLAAAAALAALMASTVPLWSQRTLGDWRETPYSAYSKVYFPFDTVGFGAPQGSGTTHELPAAFGRLGDEFRQLHDQHRLSRLPMILIERVAALVVDLGHGWRVALMVLLAAGLVHGRGVVRFGLVSTACLVVAYLAFAHPPLWTVYYFEIFPFLWFVVALELTRVLRAIAGSERGAVTATCITLAVWLPFTAADVVRGCDRQSALRGFHRAAEHRIAALPKPAIVFVRDSASHNHAFSLVENHVEVESAPVWVVHDRGPENRRLLARAPGRQAFRLDLGDDSLTRLAPATADVGRAPQSVGTGVPSGVK